MKTLNKSFVVEAALAGLFAAAAVVPAVAGDAAAPAGGDQSKPAPTKKAPAKKGAEKVHCFGVNTCKGKSECAGQDHQCKGQNACKGKGWISLTAKKCASKKGTVMPEKADMPAAPAPAAAPASK